MNENSFVGNLTVMMSIYTLLFFVHEKMQKDSTLEHVQSIQAHLSPVQHVHTKKYEPQPDSRGVLVKV